MIGTVLIAVVILAIGARAADGIRLRQQELILTKLRTADAAEFYRLLRRRAWKVRVLRAVAVLSVVTIVYARNRAWRLPAVPGTTARAVGTAGTTVGGPAGAPVEGAGSTPTSRSVRNE